MAECFVISKFDIIGEIPFLVWFSMIFFCKDTLFDLFEIWLFDGSTVQQNCIYAEQGINTSLTLYCLIGTGQTC